MKLEIALKQSIQRGRHCIDRLILRESGSADEHDDDSDDHDDDHDVDHDDIINIIQKYSKRMMILISMIMNMTMTMMIKSAATNSKDADQRRISNLCYFTSS